MMFFFEYFLLSTALVCFLWVVKVYLFCTTPIATRTLAILEDSAGENVSNVERSVNNSHFKLEENDGVLYESGGLSAKRLVGPDKSVSTCCEYDDDVNETTDDDSAPRSDAGEDSKPSEPAERGDGSPEQQYDQETTNAYEVTAGSCYGSTENDESPAYHTFSNASSDGVSVRRADVSNWQSLIGDESDGLSDGKTDEQTVDDYRSPEVINQIYFTNKKYDVNKIIWPLTDISVEDESNSSNDETNCIDVTDYKTTEIFDKSIRYTEVSNPYSSSSDYRESLPSTINSSDTSINDIKYVEDIEDIMFCKSDVSDNLNEAFIGE